MAYIRPGRLYRTLARLGIPTPLIRVKGDTFDVTDGQITSVAMSHGGTEPSPGIQPSTCETVIQRPSWIKTGEAMSVRLTDAAVLELARLTGATLAQIQDRFTGRAGRQTNIDDRGRLTARIQAASWSAQLGRLRTESFLPAGMSIHDAARFLCTPEALPQIVWRQYGTSDVLASSLGTVTFSDAIDKVTADIGTLVREARDGAMEAWSLPYRLSWAQQRLGDTYPLTRSQAISPTNWEQPNEDLPAKIRADWIGADGQPVARSAGGTPESVVQRYDWTYVKQQTPALDMRFESLVNQNWNRLFRLPSITIDLLHLLVSGQAYHIQQVGMLLELTAGDPIGLSGDWQPSLRGIHIVTGIDETINSNEWKLTLSLIPHATVFGSDSPVVPALVWESATYPWDTETRVWDH